MDMIIGIAIGAVFSKFWLFAWEVFKTTVLSKIKK